ncbi:FAD-dependent monooxygenase [Variovorax paradoxus]|uniref:FAD-dependent monooxygenase n=1 Tax=Variovorax paradoxus TaxID=34073 RepID=UPI00215E1054|nr:FAD-dependent monooxygenase [Variovorax paradoxus]UVH55131.1 FAD-dependent monooxygenase [Variovorax paradoxus]
MTANPSTAIIGAGPGGLTLARILHMRGLDATVFDRDSHALCRPQGGSLDMHEQTGRRALRLAGLDSAFNELARYGDQGSKAYAPDGTLLYAEANLDGDRPEIDRTQLRQLLLHSLPDSALRWGERVERVEPQTDDRHAVISNGKLAGTFDLVVGADGAWSNVRPTLSDAVPVYENVTVVELGIDRIDERFPELASIVGNGKFFAKGSGRAMGAQRSSNSHIRVYAFLRAEQPLSVDTADSRPFIERLLKEFSDFSPELLRFFEVANLLAARPLHALPVGHRWANHPGLTLIGDAAHLMSPFGGEGANGAMADAADLGVAITSGRDWRQAIEAFETIMFDRAEKAARIAAQGLQGIVAEKQNGRSESYQSLRKKAMNGSLIGTQRITLPDFFARRVAECTRDTALQQQLAAVVRFDISGEAGGSWIVDFRKGSAGVRRGDDVVDHVVSMGDEDFLALIDGRFSPQSAFLSGKLKFQGPLSFATKLSGFLERLKV